MVFIVACARALLVIAQEAKVLDTMLFAASGTLTVLPVGVIGQVMFLVQCVINFFIHSGTAQAALTMPIMAPLADLVGITRQTAVYAYQLCEFVNPDSAHQRGDDGRAGRGEDPVGTLGTVVLPADGDPGRAQLPAARAAGADVYVELGARGERHRGWG